MINRFGAPKHDTHLGPTIHTPKKARTLQGAHCATRTSGPTVQANSENKYAPIIVRPRQHRDPTFSVEISTDGPGTDAHLQQRQAVMCRSVSGGPFKDRQGTRQHRLASAGGASLWLARLC